MQCMNALSLMPEYTLALRAREWFGMQRERERERERKREKEREIKCKYYAAASRPRTHLGQFIGNEVPHCIKT